MIFPIKSFRKSKVHWFRILKNGQQSKLNVTFLYFDMYTCTRTVCHLLFLYQGGVSKTRNMCFYI